jgi:hypothetical protein
MMMGAGASIDWSARQEVMMLPMPPWAIVGGLAGGEENNGEDSLVTGRCDESQESADGSSMVSSIRGIAVSYGGL